MDILWIYVYDGYLWNREGIYDKYDILYDMNRI